MTVPLLPLWGAGGRGGILSGYGYFKKKLAPFPPHHYVPSFSAPFHKSLKTAVISYATEGALLIFVLLFTQVAPIGLRLLTPSVIFTKRRLEATYCQSVPVNSRLIKRI